MNFLGIFRSQNDRLVVGYLMGTEILAHGSCLKRVAGKAFWTILPCLFSNPHNLGLEWTFWTFSALKMIVMGYLMGKEIF